MSQLNEKDLFLAELFFDSKKPLERYPPKLPVPWQKPPPNDHQNLREQLLPQIVSRYNAYTPELQ